MDSCDENAFFTNLAALQTSWDEQEVAALGKQYDPCFYNWFVRTKADVFCTSTLRGTRELAGLGSPPQPFYTNANESMNSALKEKTNYTRMQWPQFNLKMLEFVKEQYCEIEKAIVDGGKYVLKEEYKSHEASDKWWKMNEEQRKFHIRRFHMQSIKACNRPTPAPSSQEIHKHKKTSTTEINLVQFQMATALPHETAKGIVQKAQEIVDDATAIAHVPGGKSKDRFIISRSQKQPHLVTAKNNSEYNCDDRCPHYQSLSICAHTIAAAYVNGEFSAFQKWFRTCKRQQNSNLYQLSKHGMPAGAGRKGSKPPRQRKRAHDIRDEHQSLPLLLSIPDSSQTQPSSEPQPSVQVLSASSLGQQTPSQGLSASSLGQQTPSQGLSTTSLGQWIPSQGLSAASLGQQTPSPSLLLPSTVMMPYPPQPPPLLPSQCQPFSVRFISGNISVCSGCKQRFPRKPTGAVCDPPNDIVIQHHEERTFKSPTTGLLTSKPGNAYYHVNLACLWTNWPGLRGQDIRVTSDVAAKLFLQHKAVLYHQLGLTIN